MQRPGPRQRSLRAVLDSGRRTPLPFAATVNGQPLTSTEAIESAADAGNVALINLGPGAVIIGAVTRSN